MIVVTTDVVVSRQLVFDFELSFFSRIYFKIYIYNIYFNYNYRYTSIVSTLSMPTTSKEIFLIHMQSISLSFI